MSKVLVAHGLGQAVLRPVLVFLRARVIDHACDMSGSRKDEIDLAAIFLGAASRLPSRQAYCGWPVSWARGGSPAPRGCKDTLGRECALFCVGAARSSRRCEQRGALDAAAAQAL